MGKFAGPDRVIFFDIGGVLLDFHGLTAARRLARKLGPNIIKGARLLWDATLVAKIERGELKPREVHALFREKSGFRGDFAEFAGLWNGQFSLNQETAALFSRVSRLHRTYLFSNTNQMHFDYIRGRYSFARQARGAVLSYELGMRKPEPRIYKAALELAEAPPEACVFIDDRRENVRAAEKAGMAGIHYKGPGRLRRALAALGITLR